MPPDTRRMASETSIMNCKGPVVTKKSQETFFTSKTTISLTKLREPCRRHGIEAKADKDSQCRNIDEDWSGTNEQHVSRISHRGIIACSLSQEVLPSMLRITFNDKGLNDWRHHQRCTSQEEISRQKDHVMQ